MIPSRAKTLHTPLLCVGFLRPTRSSSVRRNAEASPTHQQPRQVFLVRSTRFFVASNQHTGYSPARSGASQQTPAYHTKTTTTNERLYRSPRPRHGNKAAMQVRVLRTISGPRRYAAAAISPTTWFFMVEADGERSTSSSWSFSDRGCRAKGGQGTAKEGRGTKARRGVWASRRRNRMKYSIYSNDRSWRRSRESGVTTDRCRRHNVT